MSIPITQTELEQSLRSALDYLNAAGNGSFNSALNMRMESCNAQEMTMTCSYPCARWGANTIGRLHGGVVSAMLDQAMGLLCFTVSGRVPPTVEMQVSFLRPAELDQRLFVKSRALSTGRTFWHLTCEAWMENVPDKPVASASGIYFSAEYKT